MAFRNTPQNDEERTLLMTYLVKNLGQMLLDDVGDVFPCALQLLGTEAAPKTYDPRDANPQANEAELFNLALGWLRDNHTSAVVGAALCTPLVSESGEEPPAFAAQIETVEKSLLMFFPYEQQPAGWRIDDFDILDGLLVPEGLCLWRPR